ncbi:MAG: NUDIX hydrolase [Candidatus Poribacteria bacterium]|nr:NUDIX hydrolase [Candidatus Poribacteria bacterium]
MFCYDYPRPAVTVDIVVFSGDASDVLLIQRKHPPFEGHWALPGGFIEMEESLETSARRELAEETGVTDVTLTEVGAFGATFRDPRGRVITIAYATVIEKSTVNVKAGSDASAAAWFPNTDLPKLAFDHDEIIRKALEKVK